MNKDKRNNIKLLGTLTNADESGIIANANQIYDDVQQKDQETINSELIAAAGTGGSVDTRITNAVNVEKTRAEGAESALDGKITAEQTRAANAENALDGRVDTLEEAVGTGGSVDSRIASAIAAETSRAQEAEANRYTKNETYAKEEVNNLITTPNQGYVSVAATDQTTAVTDVLPAIGLADTIYRVGNWDGSQYDVTKYSEYAWNSSGYVFLAAKSSVGEVFDISEYHAGTKYANLAAALGTNGKNIPQSLRKGGMSVKFVQSSDNKYVQYKLMSDTFNTTVANWQGVDDEPTAGSNNLVKSGGVYLKINKEKQRAETSEQHLQESIDSVKEETLEENREMVNSVLENYAPVEITGDVNNAADEEDLTSVNVEGTDVLKFKDKVYNPLGYSGLGRKILRKNIVDGINTLTQSMINQPNTIYVIQYDFALREDITVPANCILEFDGGSISANSSADTIKGQNTSIKAGLVKIFNTDVTLAGTWNVAEVYPEWFGAKGDGITDDTTAIQKCVSYFKGSASIILRKKYGVSSIYIEDFSVHIEGRGAGNYAQLIGLTADTSIIHISGVSIETIIKNLWIETDKENVIGIYSDGLPHRHSTAGMWYSTIENVVFKNCYSAIKLRAIDNENQQTYDTANQYFVINSVIILGATVDLDFIGQVGQNSFNNCYFENSSNRITYIRINTKSSGDSDINYLYFNNCSFVFSNPNVDALVEFLPKQQSKVFFNGCWFEDIRCALLKDPILVECIISNSFFLNCKIPYVVLGGATGSIVVIKRSNMGFSSPKARNNYDDHGLTYIDETGNTVEEEQISTAIFHKVINETTFAADKIVRLLNAGVKDSYNFIVKHASYTYTIVEIIDPSSNHLAYITLDQTIHIHRHGNKYSVFTEKPLIGTTTDRVDVIDTSKIYKGFQYFDTTLGKQVYWNGSDWVDTTGAIV